MDHRKFADRKLGRSKGSTARRGLEALRGCCVGTGREDGVCEGVVNGVDVDFEEGEATREAVALEHAGYGSGAHALW